jgi:hypothetical protein
MIILSDYELIEKSKTGVFCQESGAGILPVLWRAALRDWQP